MKNAVQFSDPPAVCAVRADCGDWPTHPIIVVLSFLFLPIIGLCIGFLVMFLTDAFIESRIPIGSSVRSHAIESLFISLPICLLLGVAIGIALAFTIVRLRLIAIGILFLASILAWVKTSNAWSEYVALNGRDLSEKLLFYPPVVLIVISCLIGIMIGLLLIFRVLTTKETEIT